MVDKLSPSHLHHRIERVEKKPRSGKTDEVKVHSEAQQSPLPLVDQIANDIELNNKDTAQEVRRELIYKTLSKALGEEAAGSPMFKALADKIDMALQQDQISSDQIEQLLGNKGSK